MKYAIILIVAIVLYIIEVWGTGLNDTITNLQNTQKERNAQIEKILKGE